MDEKIILKVESMHCGGCVSTVEKAAHSTEGVKSVRTNLGKKLVEITGTVDPNVVIQSISETGYEAELYSGEEKTSLLKKLFRG